MKIIYIANARIPTEKAHGYQIMKMCGSFAQAGMEVELILPNRNNPRLGQISPFDYYQLEENFKIKKIHFWDPVFLMVWGGGWYYKIQTLFFTVSLFFYLIFDKSDKVIYTRDEILLPLLTFFSDKVVWEAHDFLKNRKIKFWKKCFSIVTITQGLKNVIINSGVDNKKVMVAPDAVDLEIFNRINEPKEVLRKKFGLPIERKIILYAGHLYEWKGVQILADAAGLLPENNVVVFVGGVGADLENFQKKYGSNHQIIIVGHISHDLVPRYLKAADVLALPNSARYEISKSYTSPMKLFEYMASGRPIIASNLPSLREILTEKDSLFFEPDNATDLAAKIIFSLKNYEAMEKLAASAAQRAREFTWPERAQKIINFIK